jgi:hypothetical protein
MIKKLPIGLQGFEQIRRNNFIYVDKTKYFYDLAQSEGVYFLSRPRRFGKSLTLDTFKCLFEGKKELFEGLYIYDKWDWSKTYPVIHVSFASIKHTNEKPLEKDILKELKRISDYLNVYVPDSDNDYKNYFKDLILNAHKKYNTQVVVLIDEYDKPILDNIQDEKLAIKIREVLKNFYEVLKDVSPILRFLFLTGVSKFTKTSIFSGLNNLNDITLDDNYSAICGYTQNELEFYFKDYLKGVDLQKVKEWYNGYFWGSSPENFLKNKDKFSVYNPFDILLFINKGNFFNSHWFRTGNPEFLTKLLIQKKFFTPSLENIEIEISDLDVFDIDTIEVNALLFQTGYLTIKNIKQKDALIVYELSYPNFEVKTALNKFLLPYYLNGNKSQSTSFLIKLQDALTNEKIDEVVEILKSVYASIPYSWIANNKLNEFEGYYATVFYISMRATGLECEVESETNVGRIDLSIKTQKTIYIMEFKVAESTKVKSKKEKSVKSKAQKNKAVQKKSKSSNKTNGALFALKQILEKKYYEKYLNENKKIVLVGIEFSKKLRNIKSYKTKEI